MARHDLAPWLHRHEFLDRRDEARQRRTLWVVWLTLVTMALEIFFGYWTGSMALLADGWHMGTHAAALALAIFAWRYARRQADNPRFTFGTGKVSALGGYTSALLLGIVAFWMIWESVLRLLHPETIAYREALLVVVIGLVVNLVSVWLLRGEHDHAHGHEHAHEGEQDHNFQGAFLHVLADLLTSVLALAALLCGAWLGWARLDPLMGFVGAALILYWGAGLLRASGRILLDAEDHEELSREIIAALESRPDHKVVDLHIWRLGVEAYGCIVALLTHRPDSTENYRRQISALGDGQLKHVTVEINRCVCDAESL
jgi:cation diffusion facilitator family transporter